MEWKIPLADVNLGNEEKEAVLGVLDSGWLTMGSRTLDFEKNFAEYVGVKHAFAITNCTAALHLACQVLDINPGDEIILPSLTFVATANAICYSGAAPIFADIQSLDDLCISPQSIEERITPKTRAIMVMHYGGYPCAMEAIQAIAQRHHLAVIEDAAHAVGASLQAKNIGNWGDIACFSFFGNKNMTTGEGGMITTNRDDLAEKIRLLRSHGMTTLTWDRHQGHAQSYDVVAIGYNYRIDEIRSAIGAAQLKKLPALNHQRAQHVKRYQELFQERCPQVRVPFGSFRGQPSFHIMPILLPEALDKGVFFDQMKQKGIQTSFHYPPVHTFSVYDQTKPKGGFNLPNTEQAAKRQVTLPLFPSMTDDSIDFIIDTVQDILERHYSAFI